MSRTYLFTPKTLKGKNPKPKKGRVLNSNEELLNKYKKIIIRSFIFYGIILAIDFFVFINLFSNINNIWGFIKPSENNKVQEDKLKPRKPFLKAEEEYTNKDKANLSGRAEAGKTVVLFKDNNYYSESLADSEGKYFFNDVPINTQKDSYTEFYTIVKADGVESNPSQTVKVYFDKEKPKLEVSSPKKDDRIKSFSRTLEVKGKTEEGTQVTINGRIARINLNNEFSGTIRLEDGVNVIKVVAKDKAGNESVVEVPVYFEKIK